MNRRSAIKYLIGGSAIAAVGGGYHWLMKERDLSELAMDLMLERLNELDVTRIEKSGEWEVARTFNHLAQSVEFSLDGFPILKSPLFRNTAGQLAFSVFQANGRMTHGLDEAIPGEIIDGAGSDPLQARQRLIAALARFESHAGQLQPHFAYGELDKTQYSIAHVMHISNHLEEFQIS